MQTNIERGTRSEKTSTLSRFPDKLHGTVVDITADGDLQCRLMGMGLFVGTRFQILQRGTKRSRIPFVIAIGETRIAVDSEIAEMILVES